MTSLIAFTLLSPLFPGAPDNLDFDGGGVVQDDPRFHDYNLDYYMDLFVSTAQSQAAHMRTEHIMVLIS